MNTLQEIYDILCQLDEGKINRKEGKEDIRLLLNNILYSNDVAEVREDRKNFGVVGYDINDKKIIKINFYASVNTVAINNIHLKNVIKFL